MEPHRDQFLDQIFGTIVMGMGRLLVGYADDIVAVTRAVEEEPCYDTDEMLAPIACGVTRHTQNRSAPANRTSNPYRDKYEIADIVIPMKRSVKLESSLFTCTLTRESAENVIGSDNCSFESSICIPYSLSPCSTAYIGNDPNIPTNKRAHKNVHSDRHHYKSG